MSRLRLKSIQRSNTQSWLSQTVTVKFGNYTAWNGNIQPGQTINLSPSPQTGPFNGSDRFHIFSPLPISGNPLIDILDPVVNPTVSDLPLGPGNRSPRCIDLSTVYTLNFEVTGNIVTSTYALILGFSNALIAFITSVVFLFISYFQSFAFFSADRPNAEDNSRPD